MKLSALSTAAFAVGLLAASQATAQTTPPAGWTCPAGFFDTDDGCDCGCGVADPDCADATLAACEFDQCRDDATTNTVPDPSNTTACIANACGDDVIDGDEDCDDGNNVAGDGCSPTCEVETGFACAREPRVAESRFRQLGSTCRAIVCGDSRIDGDEDCDDGNATPGDGCSATCTEETGFACVTPGQPCQAIVCGDGSIDGNEDCDDGNAIAGDGCSNICEREEGFGCAEPGQPCIAIPAAWTCDPDYFGLGDGCDCGCAVVDPDCPSARAEDCEFNECEGDLVPDAADNSQCVAAGGGGGEGEGENPGEGEGENPGGEGEGENPRTQDDDEPEDEGGICAAGPAAKAPLAGLLLALAALSRRRRR